MAAFILSEADVSGVDSGNEDVESVMDVGFIDDGVVEDKGHINPYLEIRKSMGTLIKSVKNCDSCGNSVSYKNWAKHVRTMKHMKNAKYGGASVRKDGKRHISDDGLHSFSRDGDGKICFGDKVLSGESVERKRRRIVNGPPDNRAGPSHATTDTMTQLPGVRRKVCSDAREGVKRRRIEVVVQEKEEMRKGKEEEKGGETEEVDLDVLFKEFKKKRRGELGFGEGQKQQQSKSDKRCVARMQDAQLKREVEMIRDMGDACPLPKVLGSLMRWELSMPRLRVLREESKAKLRTHSLCGDCWVWVPRGDANRHRRSKSHQVNAGEISKQEVESQNWLLTLHECTDKYILAAKLARLASDAENPLGSFLVAREFGICGRSPHLHVYLGYRSKVVREHVQNCIWNIQLPTITEIDNTYPDVKLKRAVSASNKVHAEIVRNVQATLRYITKEDHQSALFAVDADQLNWNFRMQRVIEASPTLGPYSYVPMQYQRVFQMRHSAYWNAVLGQRDSVTATEYMNGRTRKFLRVLGNITERGVFLYGPTGTGKTVTAMGYSGDSYSFNGSSNFPFTSYTAETNIMMDGATPGQILKHRQKILQLTAGYSCPVEVKGGRIYRLKFHGKFIITSNFDIYHHPTLGGAEWKRRFAFVQVLQDSIKIVKGHVCWRGLTNTIDEVPAPCDYYQTTEQLFDPTMKKKKKKKTMYNPDAPDGGDAATNAPPSSVEEAPAEEKAASGDEGGYDAGVTEDISLDFSGRKKKKKKAKVVDTMDMKEVKEALPEGSEEKEEEDENKEPSTENIEELLLLKKKPRKAKVAIDKDLDKDGDNDDTDGSAVKAVGEKSWTGSDRDYIYDELLTRVFDIMREKNPEMIAGEKKKIVMRPPQVLKAGARRTSFANFADISRMLHRQPKHVLAFLLAELGTSGSVDGNNQLIIRGKFNQKQIENVLRRYIKEYVMCHTCKSSDTLMQKEERLFFLQCETCGSRCSVASIKSGFQAVTGRRAAMRAK